MRAHALVVSSDIAIELNSSALVFIICKAPRSDAAGSDYMQVNCISR